MAASALNLAVLFRGDCGLTAILLDHRRELKGAGQAHNVAGTLSWGLILRTDRGPGTGRAVPGAAEHGLPQAKTDPRRSGVGFDRGAGSIFTRGGHEGLAVRVRDPPMR